MKKLTTFNQVVAELDGLKGIAALCGRSVQSVWNWQSRGFFPAVLWLVITAELSRRGCTVDPKLFRLEKADAA